MPTCINGTVDVDGPDVSSRSASRRGGARVEPAERRRHAASRSRPSTATSRTASDSQRRVNEDKATRYHRLKRAPAIASLAWSVVLLAGLLVDGRQRRAAKCRASACGRASSSGSDCCRVAPAALVNEVGSLPLAFLQRIPARAPLRAVEPSRSALAGRSTSSSRSPSGWSSAAGAASVVYFFIRRCAGRLVAAGRRGLRAAHRRPGESRAGAAAAALLQRQAARARVAARTAARARRSRRRARARRYEWGLAAKTKKANAALAGLGGTRRILVSDTMLADYSDDEIEVVLAHELAHHVHGDIWKGLSLRERADSGGLLSPRARVLRAWRRLVRAQRPRRRRRAAAAAAAAGAVSLVMVPAAHAMSRALRAAAPIASR